MEGAEIEKVYHVFRSYGGAQYFEKGEDEYVFDIINPKNKPLYRIFRWYHHYQDDKRLDKR